MTGKVELSRGKYAIGVLSRYSTAVATTGLAIWARFLLNPWLQEECPFSLFYLSVLVTAWIGGIGPARFAIVLGSFAAALFFIQPSSSLYMEDLADVLQLTIYILVNCVATSLFNRVERQKRDAEDRSEENQRLSQSLRDADARKDEFLALLAHELRNPLAPIRSGISLLEREQTLAEVGRVCRMMRRHSDHLVHLTNDLLDVSRFCRGTMKLELSHVNLQKAVENAVEMTISLIESKRHRLHVWTAQQATWVNGDSVRLTQMIGNLLSNAAKYTPEGGRISLQTECNQGIVSVSVKDNGIGFHASEVDRILEPFVQINMSRTRDYGGLGVGLTIVDRLATMHGGRLIASSPGPGMGSCFTIELPAVKRPRAAESSVTALEYSCSPKNLTTQSEDAPRKCDLPTGNATKRIFLVDDNVDAAQILAELLQLEGFELHLAHDGFTALETAERIRPDMIILDIGLPGMDGFEVARRLRRSSATSSSKLVALSGWAAAADRECGAHVGFDEYLVKPIQFPELLDTVHRMLETGGVRPLTIGASLLRSDE